MENWTLRILLWVFLSTLVMVAVDLCILSEHRFVVVTSGLILTWENCKAYSIVCYRSEVLLVYYCVVVVVVSGLETCRFFGGKSFFLLFKVLVWHLGIATHLSICSYSVTCSFSLVSCYILIS